MAFDLVLSEVGAAVVLGWRWPALRPGTGREPGLVVTVSVLAVVLVTAGLAVT